MRLLVVQISVGLYHTAGKGTRLAPMPGSENNNKPGVKLAVTADINGKPSPLTILESVVKQTGVYGKSRKGRLSVFWGDQVGFRVGRRRGFVVLAWGPVCAQDRASPCVRVCL